MSCDDSGLSAKGSAFYEGYGSGAGASCTVTNPYNGTWIDGRFKVAMGSTVSGWIDVDAPAEGGASSVKSILEAMGTGIGTVSVTRSKWATEGGCVIHS